MAFLSPPIVAPQSSSLFSSASSSRTRSSFSHPLTGHRVRLRMNFDAGLSALKDCGYGSGRRLPGTVYLVGGGPGDLSLLTDRARTLLSKADVILYDRLVGQDALTIVKSDATLIYVGKRAGYHTRTQEEICALLAAFANVHDIVVRLKGGDPGVYGRGGEEAAYLREKRVKVEFIPGITAASAVAANLGFPLTHRGIADSLRFVTGHARSGGLNPPVIKYESSDTTLVLYMGLAQLPHILEDAISQGLDVNTPAVAVEKASTKHQRVVWGTASTLPDNVVKSKLESPTLVVVGYVVALAPEWNRIMGTHTNSEKYTQDVDELLRGLRDEDRAIFLQSMTKRS